MANISHCNEDSKPEMSDNANCSRDSRPERETSFVDVKSLLDEVIFPLYRPLILNPVRETDVDLAQFRSDPDVRSPRSFRGFIERVTTFKPQTWGADPNAALYFAKHGWRGTTDCNIRCNVCLTSIDCSHVLNKGQLWFILAKQGHATLCPFQFISTPDDLFKLPTDPLIIQQNVTKIWGSLITLETELPSITEDVISDLGIENKVVDLFFKVLDSPVTEFGLSALVLGLCGWVKGNSRNTIECNFCQRCVGLWNFFSIADKTPSISSQQEPVPSSSSGVPSHEKDAHSPKPASPSVCSEHSPSQEIIPSDCEVPLDSNDYVSEECSETSDVESGDGVEEEEEGEEGEDFEEYDQSSSMDIPRSMSKSRSTGKRKKMYDSNSEEPSEDSDDEVASRSNVSSYVSFRDQGLEKNMFSVDSSDLLERDRIIQLARKIKKRAITRLYGSRVRYADYRARFSNENSENYVKGSCTKSSLGSVDKDQQLGTCGSLSVGQAIDTTSVSGSYNDIQEEEDDDSDMEWNRETERVLEETKLEICNGPSRCELPDSNFKLVLECQSPSVADDGSVDPLDTQGVKRTLEDVHGEDLNDSSSIKRRKVGSDPREKEISSISECTLVNVKEITNRLSEHGVTLAKCDPIQIGPQSEAAEPRERGTKRKASSMDEEQAETDRSTLHPRKDLANVEVAIAEGLPCKDSNVTDELKNKINDSDVSNEPSNLSKENSSTISVKDGKEGSKNVSDGVSQDDVEIPVDMRNGIDSSKLNSENECEVDSATSHKEGQGKIINSNKITLHETAVSNGDIKGDPVEGSHKIPNGDSAIVSPDSRHEDKSGSDRMNGKLESESIGPCNSTTDHGNEVVEDSAKREIGIVQAEADTIDTKMDVSESSKPDHAGAENHEVRVNESEENDETSVAHSFAKIPEGGEISAHPVSNDVEINSSVSEEKKIVIPHEKLVSKENPVSCGVEPIKNDSSKENEDIEIKKIENVDSESSCTVAETNINTDKSDVAMAGSNVADTETNSAENKSNDDVKVHDDRLGDIKSDVSSGEVEKVQCLSSHGNEIDDSIDEKTDIVSDDKVETSQANVDADKSPGIKEDSHILVDSSANAKDSDVSVQEDGLERNNKEDILGEKLQSLSEQKIPVSNDAMENELKVSECPVVDDKQDVVMECSEQEDKDIGIDSSTDKRNEVDTGNTEDKENREEVEVSGPPPEVPLGDSCEQKEPDDKDVSQDCAESNKNTDEEVVSRKRRHSSVEEEEEQEESHKKLKTGEPIAKVDFHPIKEHRFWCIYRLNTATSNGDVKPGWAQLRDGLRLGLSMECVPYNDMVDLKEIRMRLAKHLAHW